MTDAITNIIVRLLNTNHSPEDALALIRHLVSMTVEKKLKLDPPKSSEVLTADKSVSIPFDLPIDMSDNFPESNLPKSVMSELDILVSDVLELSKAILPNVEMSEFDEMLSDSVVQEVNPSEIGTAHPKSNAMKRKIYVVGEFDADPSIQQVFKPRGSSPLELVPSPPLLVEEIGRVTAFGLRSWWSVVRFAVVHIAS
nr:hypothetical protein Iba_chr10dCG10050 [Ipomoea batatas]